MLPVSLLKKLLHDRVSALGVKFDVASLLILHDDRHSFTSAIEFEDVEDFVAKSVAKAIADYYDIISLTSNEFKAFGLSTFHESLLVRRGCVVHTLVLINHNGVANG